MKINAWMVFAILLAGCQPYYSNEDFPSVKKVDTHVHLNSSNPAIGELAHADNFRLLTVNVDAHGTSLPDQKKYALEQMKQFPGRIDFLTAFSLQDWGKEKWKTETLDYLKKSFDEGALGIKIWKNIGMVYKDSLGRFIMVDDPAFDPIIAYVIQQDKTVLGHLGEPKNCWLPLEKMTVNNDRHYFKEHPEYHMFLHPDYPSYEDQINARDKFLEKHPDLRFVGAHLGSLEWDVDELAKRLDKFPNMAADMAARIPHLQYQSRLNREKIRNFIIKYADRLIYATDSGIDVNDDPEQAKKSLHETWLADWKYFATDDAMTVSAVEGEFTGLKLPKDVINKIYHDNAVTWFRMPPE
ncbi:MAG TPA: amidohydrolase family protein [Chryseolinea sp.]|nr:amidohydrolase family protein [Chryseolinea sp.]